MFRFWVSWWTGYYEDEGCSKPGWTVWISGERETRSDGRNEVSICSVMDAPSEDSVWNAISHHFPDYEERFCNLKPSDFEPNNRFPGPIVAIVSPELWTQQDRGE